MQAFYCPGCKSAYTAELRGHSCPACGEELIHGRIPAGKQLISRNSSGGGTGRAVWDTLLKRDICCYCKQSISTTIDHIVPKALGGSKGSWTNRTGSCFQCNQDKAHTPLLYFMLEQAGEDLSWMKDEDDHWPLPEIRTKNEVMSKNEELSVSQHFNPHVILLKEEAKRGRRGRTPPEIRRGYNPPATEDDDRDRWLDDGGPLVDSDD